MAKVPRQRTSGNLELGTPVFNLLRHLADRSLSGLSATNTVAKFINNMTPHAADILRRIIKKDMRIGINIKTVNHVWPGLVPEFNVTLCEGYDAKYAKYPCYASPKIDGIRGYYAHQQFKTRNGHTLMGLDHLIEEMTLLGVGCADGELHVPGYSFDDTSGLIRNLGPLPGAVFNVFDLPNLNAPFYARYSAITGIFSIGEMCKYVEHIVVFNEEEARAYYNQKRKEGFEGIVLKYFDMPYIRSRGPHWMRMVPEVRVDVTVTDVIEGSGKFQGMAGSLLCDFLGTPVRVANRFTEEQRIKFFEEPESIIGATLELIVKEKSKKGKFRSGRCIRIRYDK